MPEPIDLNKVDWSSVSFVRIADDEKVCGKCQFVKNISDFHKNRTAYDGFQSECKECRKEYNSSNVKKYHENHEHSLKLNRKYRKAHPKREAEKARKRRAGKTNVTENFSSRDVNLIMRRFNNQCFNCKNKEDLCIDHHLPLSLGHALTTKNAVVLCRSCNSSKSNRLPENFYTIEQIQKLNSIMEIKDAKNITPEHEKGKGQFRTNTAT